MQERIKEIAGRVRELRELMNVCPESVAKTLHVPVETYMKYESGEEDIPASLLLEIATQLKVDMGVLLTGEAPRMHVFTVSRKNHGVHVERGRQYRYENLVANFIHKKAEFFVVTVEPKGPAEPCHYNVHPGQEFVFVLEGTLKLHIHGNELVLAPEDSVLFDSNYSHAMQAVGDTAVRFLAIIV